jgi:hypothetical protein
MQVDSNFIFGTNVTHLSNRFCVIIGNDVKVSNDYTIAVQMPIPKPVLRTEEIKRQTLTTISRLVSMIQGVKEKPDGPAPIGYVKHAIDVLVLFYVAIDVSPIIPEPVSRPEVPVEAPAPPWTQSQGSASFTPDEPTSMRVVRTETPTDGEGGSHPSQSRESLTPSVEDQGPIIEPVVDEVAPTSEQESTSPKEVVESREPKMEGVD